MKKHELLKYAYDNYPKGTFIEVAFNGGNMQKELTGQYRIDEDLNIYSECKGRWTIYHNGFNKWAEIIPEQTERKLIMKSEDGVDIYERDRVVTVNIKENRIANSDWISRSKVIHEKKYSYKYFVSLTAAEYWIEEANKPKSVTIPIGSDNFIYAVVTKSKVTLNRKYSGYHTLSIHELESIYKAYQSLIQ